MHRIGGKLKVSLAQSADNGILMRFRVTFIIRRVMITSPKDGRKTLLAKWSENRKDTSNIFKKTNINKSCILQGSVF